MESGSRNHSPKAAMRRLSLRENMGVSEKIFWEIVRKDRLGYRFRRQVAVGDYFLDFYCASAQLAVELDGQQHADQVEYDAKRDAFLRSCGIETIRIPTLDLFDETGELTAVWKEQIVSACKARTARFKGHRGTSY